MGYGLINTEILTGIANAIRQKLGVQTQYKPGQMADAIESISGGGITPSGTKSITENGTYDVTTFASADVNVPSSGITPTGTKSISITQNGTTTEDVAIYANAQISVNVVNQDYEDALVALGVQSDLTDGIEALTAYSNGVTGESDTNLSDAVHTLGSGYGQGGSALPPWVSSVETVTIGTNTVTNTSAAKDYFNSYAPYFAIVLKTAPNTQNQLVNIVNNGTSSLRYRGGVIEQSTVTASRDAVLVEGTQYDVYHF